MFIAIRFSTTTTNESVSDKQWIQIMDTHTITQNMNMGLFVVY